MAEVLNQLGTKILRGWVLENKRHCNAVTHFWPIWGSPCGWVDATAGSAEVVADKTITVVVLGGPVTIHCHAIGWPRPSVTWWRADRMLPFSSFNYEQNRDFSLLIRSVTYRDLGPYTCQVYNGYGRPSSYTVVLQAIGPVYSIDEADIEFRRYLIPAPEAPREPSFDPRVARPPRPNPEQPRSPARRIDRPTAQPQRPTLGKTIRVTLPQHCHTTTAPFFFTWFNLPITLHSLTCYHHKSVSDMNLSLSYKWIWIAIPVQVAFEVWYGEGSTLLDYWLLNL